MLTDKRYKIDDKVWARFQDWYHDEWLHYPSSRGDIEAFLQFTGIGVQAVLWETVGTQLVKQPLSR